MNTVRNSLNSSMYLCACVPVCAAEEEEGGGGWGVGVGVRGRSTAGGGSGGGARFFFHACAVSCAACCVLDGLPLVGAVLCRAVPCCDVICGLCTRAAAVVTFCCYSILMLLLAALCDNELWYAVLRCALRCEVPDIYCGCRCCIMLVLDVAC